MLQLGQREIGLPGHLRLDVGLDLRRDATGWPGPVTHTLGLSCPPPLAHYLARPSMADSKIERNRLQAVCATVIRGQKLPPQIVIEGSRHSFRVARKSPENSLHYL
jgi:hypothetical protein